MEVTPDLDDARTGAAATRGAPFGRRRFHWHLVAIVTLLVATAGLFAPSPPAEAATSPEVGASRLLVGTWKIWWSDDVTATFADGSPVAVVPQTYCAATPNLYRDITAIGLWSYQMRQYPCNPAYSGSSPGRMTLAAEGNELRLSAAIDGAGTAVLWLRTHPGYQCAGGPLTVEQAMRFANAVWGPDATGPELEEATDFLADPCPWFDLTFESGDVVLTDAGTDPAIVAGSITQVPCTKAVFTVRVRTELNRFSSVELGSYDMATRFCHDGSKVWMPGRPGFPPAATVENLTITGLGRAYQLSFLQAVVGTSGFLNQDQAAAETTITTNWSGGLPIIKWAWPEQDFVTATLRVDSNGTSQGRMGS